MLSKFPDGRNSLSLFMALATFFSVQNKEINKIDRSLTSEKSLGTILWMFDFFKGLQNSKLTNGIFGWYVQFRSIFDDPT